MRRRRKKHKKPLRASSFSVRGFSPDFHKSNKFPFLVSCLINAGLFLLLAVFSVSPSVQNSVRDVGVSFGVLLEESVAPDFPEDAAFAESSVGGFFEELLNGDRQDFESIPKQTESSLSSVETGVLIPDFTNTSLIVSAAQNDAAHDAQESVQKIASSVAISESSNQGAIDAEGLESSRNGIGNGNGSESESGKGPGKRIGRMFVEGEKIGVVLDVSGSMENHHRNQMLRARRLASSRDLIIELDGCSYGNCHNGFTSRRTVVSEALTELIGKGVDAIYHICDLQDGQSPEYINALRPYFIGKNVRLYISSLDKDASPELREIIRDSGGRFELNGRLISLNEE